MIAIFTLLGLGLFGGGLYAVYDGWPYLVLERGFTEVIIGSVMATAGLIMLSLAWVLKQLQSIKTELAAAARGALPVAAETVIPVPPSLTPAESGPAAPSPVLPAALGLGAGAAAIAAAVAEKPEAVAPGGEPPERDLFGSLVADSFAAAPEESADEPEQAPAPMADDAVAELPDMFATDTADREPAESVAPVAVEDESHEPAEIVAAHVQPLSQDEALARSDDQAGAADRFGADGPIAEPEEFAVADRSPVEDAAERDEFIALRESLTGQLGGLHEPAGRIEPSFTPEADPFAEAEAWMDPAAARREPRFELPSASFEDDGAEAPAPAPVWPPRTEAHSFDGPAVDELDGSEAAVVSEPAGSEPSAPEPASLAVAEADAPEPVEAEAPRHESPAEISEPSAPAPAASEEGIVGAYQVGEAHFTIYADGSIRARTPDGEYSFASMDELKVYLVSEKSRLGV